MQNASLSRHVFRQGGALAMAIALLGACGSEVLDGSSGPHVESLSTSQLTVGQTLRFYGKGFATPDAGYTQLQFDGEYRSTNADGRSSNVPVSSAMRVIYEGELHEATNVGGTKLDAGTQILRVNRFGPFTVPFGNQNRPGRFVGTVKAVNVLHDGTTEEDEFPAPVEVEVKPSILVRTLAPVINEGPNGEPEVAPCGGPALRLIAGSPDAPTRYVLEVQAMGFAPRAFSYEIIRDDRTDRFFHELDPRQQVDGGVDTLGNTTVYPGETIEVEALSDYVGMSYVTIAVRGYDVEGKEHLLALPIEVVRPLQAFHDGQRLLAEYYEPMVVHGPIVGGLGGLIHYQESHSESRQKGMSVTLSEDFSESGNVTNSEDWSEGITTGTSSSTSEDTSTSEGISETNPGVMVTESSSEDTSFSYSTNDGNTWTAGLGGTSNPLSLGGLLSVAANLTGGFSSTSGSSESNTTTTSTGVSKTFASENAVSTQTSINNSTGRSEATSESVTQSTGGGKSVSEGYSKGSSEAWGDTWSESEDYTTSLGYASKVPRGRCGTVYRQTVRFVRKAQLYAHDMCGVRSTAADMVFTDWIWSPNITISDDCDAGIPPSSQPKAQCFHACE